ncbi:SDR family NAD(P)-dependent oxidoreductase [Nocardioides iriomotensis]|uniref:SDR family oxidoreductase n=1 Tax=Nocardioides iriomotensis TaxID=715784 RepID=A0A4Q5J8M3_9ACTN|nr:SDR family oxidoreductase [Nocardioides iriomotensis]RYU14101.1 SDR family oxidoreductase [Nocardioides iriomotensis]
MSSTAAPTSRTALVTGPTAGIGASFARQLAARGDDLVLVARDSQRLEQLAAELRAAHGVEVEVLVADLADREQLARVERRVADSDRPVHLLVNNAGFGHKRPFLENSVEDEQQMLDVLVTAVLRLTHAALGAMVARGEGQVVNVSSVAGYLPRGTYSAAKAYVTSLSRWADATYRPQGVQVMALLPGFTKTEFHARMDVSRGSAPRWMWLDADRLVRDALADLDAGKQLSIPSKRYKVLAGLSRVVPVGVLSRFQRLGRR